MATSDKSAPKRAKQARSLAELASQPDPIAPLEVKLFLRATAPVLRKLEADLSARARESASVCERLAAEHARQVEAQRTGDEYDAWLGALVEQVAAAWVLACVFVRTLEDRGLVRQNRIAGPGASDSLREFLSLAPSLSERDYIELCLRELLHDPAAEPLFGRENPLWLLAPSAEGARALLEVFRAPSAEAPALRFGQADTRFLGDLYQDLNENVRERYALLQTPKFVEEYILDRTLEPAIERFGLEQTTLIDPTCGSGHFLLGAFERLFERHQRVAPNERPEVLAEKALAQVYGTDINPYAVAITRFRLVLAFLEVTGTTKLKEAPKLTLNVVVADSLLHRGDGESEGRARNGDRRWYALEDEQAAERVLNPEPKFAAVVGNPPYITVKDDALRELYRKAYPRSAAGKYSMGAPFTERLFDLARQDGRVGMITANSFMKREFGKKLITEFLPTVDLDFIVNSAGAYIPGHGTPTVLLFGTHRKPRGGSVLAVLGKRGEPSTPEDASKGLVWSSIRKHGEEVGHEDDYISVAKVAREKLRGHPWSLAGGGAEELKALLEERADKRLGDIAASIGIASFTLEDDVYLRSEDAWRRVGVDEARTRPMVIGEAIRDWSVGETPVAFFPYDHRFSPIDDRERSLRALWAFRTNLANNMLFGGKTKVEGGLRWYEYGRLTVEKLRTPLTIAFAFVATHNHFVLDRGGKVFKQTAPIIKLPEGATEDDHLALLAYLNSSTACFWMKQVFYPKGGELDWEDRFEYAGTGMLQMPVPAGYEALAGYGRKLAAIGETMRGKSLERSGLNEMVRTQEALDWSVYRLWGLDVSAECSRIDPDDRIGHRLIEELIWHRAEEGRQKSRWFECNGYHIPPDPVCTEIRAARRNAVTDRRVAILEDPSYKRPWRAVDINEREERDHIAERLEALEEFARSRSAPVPRRLLLARAGALSEVFVDRYVPVAGPGINVDALLQADSVPFSAAWRYTDPGLAKYRQWQATWDLQRREDAGEKIARILVPPKYDQKDFRRSEYWRLRGKLDVPKERFISYPGLESDEDGEPLYGWAGWDHAKRARALVELYQTRKDDEGWPTERLIPALAGLHELLPWVKQWHNEPDAAYDGARFGDDLAAFLAEELRSHGLTEAQLLAWRPEGGMAKKTGKKLASRPSAASAVPVSLRKSQPENDNEAAAVRGERRARQNASKPTPTVYEKPVRKKKAER